MEGALRLAWNAYVDQQPSIRRIAPAARRNTMRADNRRPLEPGLIPLENLELLADAQLDHPPERKVVVAEIVCVRPLDRLRRHIEYVVNNHA